MVIVEKLYDFGKREKVMVGLIWKEKSAWDYIQERDKEMLGDDITDPKEQHRWSRTVFLAGGLPYMWDRSEEFKELMYESLNLEKGDKILIVGEAIDACGFLEEVKKRLHGEGEIQAFEIIDKSRCQRAFKNGKPGPWQYDYADKYTDEYFDVVFFPQGIHHQKDWEQGARDFLRVLKKGGRIVFPEIAIGLKREQDHQVQSDLMLENIIKKIRVGSSDQPKLCSSVWERYGATQPGPDELDKYFGQYLENKHSFIWKGLFLYYGDKK